MKLFSSTSFCYVPPWCFNGKSRRVRTPNRLPRNGFLSLFLRCSSAGFFCYLRNFRSFLFLWRLVIKSFVKDGYGLHKACMLFLCQCPSLNESVIFVTLILLWEKINKVKRETKARFIKTIFFSQRKRTQKDLFLEPWTCQWSCQGQGRATCWHMSNHIGFSYVRSHHSFWTDISLWRHIRAL